MKARSLVFDVQDQVRGRGRLVRTREGEWFDPPLLVPLNFNRAAPTPSRYAIPVEGADFDAVGWRREQDGGVEGNATIYGQWLGDRISVHRQTDEPPDPVVLTLVNPPCDAPPGGWPRPMDGQSPDDMIFDLGELEGAEAIMVSIFRPDPDRAVLVVATTDIAVVEAQLRPQLGDRLCVVASRWTREQLAEMHEHLWARSEPWSVYETGFSCDEQAQAVMSAKLVRVTDEIASWADSQPAGLITLEPCLTPVNINES